MHDELDCLPTLEAMQRGGFDSLGTLKELSLQLTLSTSIPTVVERMSNADVERFKRVDDIEADSLAAEKDHIRRRRMGLKAPHLFKYRLDACGNSLLRLRLDPLQCDRIHIKFALLDYRYVDIFSNQKLIGVCPEQVDHLWRQSVAVFECHPLAARESRAGHCSFGPSLRSSKDVLGLIGDKEHFAAFGECGAQCAPPVEAEVLPFVHQNRIVSGQTISPV
ncbi:MAG: hypothetical protein F4102_03865 [Chloroflexi bacterium]|nr:hypothetical protein [Chloroflexota bacterium]